jgi:hypothetical protein
VQGDICVMGAVPEPMMGRLVTQRPDVDEKKQ